MPVYRTASATTITKQFTTYCPEPTTLTHSGKIYTITKATTITIPQTEVKTIPATTPSKVSSPPKESSPAQPPVYKSIAVKSPSVYVPAPIPSTHASAPQPSSNCPVCPVTNCPVAPSAVTVTVTVTAEPKGSAHAPTTAPAAKTTYACNPAHSYPGSSSCISTKGSLTLVGPTTAAPLPSTTFACNPAHSYPNSQTCIRTGTGVTLVTATPSVSVGAYIRN